MSIQVFHEQDMNFIHTVLTGPTSEDDLHEAVRRRVVLQGETGIRRLFVDIRQIDYPASVPDLFTLAANLYSEHNLLEGCAMALILPSVSPEREKGLAFVESCRGQGWLMSGFTEESEGARWLREQPVG